MTIFSTRSRIAFRASSSASGCTIIMSSYSLSLLTSFGLHGPGLSAGAGVSTILWRRAGARRECTSIQSAPVTCHSLVFMHVSVLGFISLLGGSGGVPVSYTHLRAHETDSYLVCRLLLEKKNKQKH